MGVFKENLQVLESETKTADDDRGIRILRRKSEIDFKKLSTIHEIINAVPVLEVFISKMEKGQKLVLDISKETMRKIQSGELKIMETKEGVLKAEICDPNGIMKEHMNVKYEEFCKVPNPIELANMAQIVNMKQQLQAVVEELESLGRAVRGVLVGQQNDRIGLYKSGEELYLEAKVIKNTYLQQQLIGVALKSLEDARMQMIENIKTDITSISAYDHGRIKMKSQEINEILERINLSFDVINRASFLKAGIYYEQDEMQAMLLSLEQYSVFLSEQINKNAKLLYDYDKADKCISGKWHERSEKLPQTIDSLIEKYNRDQQVLEVEYQTLYELGVFNHG